MILADAGEGAAVVPERNEEGGHRSRRDMGDVVADEKSRERAVEGVEYVHSLLCAPVSVVLRKLAHLDLVERGKTAFGCREVAAEDYKDNE